MKQYEKTELFETAPVRKALLALAVPTILNHLVTLLYNLADAFYVGQTGNAAMLAAVSLSWPFYLVLNALGNLFSIGGCSVISRALGSKDEERATRASAFCFYVALGTSLILGLAIVIGQGFIAEMLGAEGENLAYTKDYIFWAFGVGAVPTVLSLTLGSCLRGEGDSKHEMLGLGLGHVLNVILDPIFIFVFNLGVAGAAIATMLSNAVSVLYFLLYIRKKKERTIISVKPRWFSLEKKLAGEIISIGLPASFNTVLTSISATLLNNLLAGYSPTIAVSAIGVVKKLDTITIQTTMGLTQGALPLIAYNFASKNYKRMEDVRRLTMVSGLVISCTTLMIFQILPSFCIRIFIEDAEVIGVGVKFLRILSLASPFAMLNYMIRTVFQAIGKPKQSFIVSICRQGLVFIPVLFIMDALVGMFGLVWAQLAADGISDIVAFLMFRSVKRRLMVMENAAEIRA